MGYRAASVVTAGDSADISRFFSAPGGAQIDDILYAVFYIENTTKTASISPGTWVKIAAASGEQLADTVDWEISVFRCHRQAADSLYNVEWDGTSIWNTVAAAAYTGRDTATPEDVTGTFNAPGSASTTATATGVTTTTPNADIIAAATNRIGSAHTWAGVTARADFGGVSFGDAVQASPGATGNKTAGITSAFFAAALVALREAPTGTPSGPASGLPLLFFLAAAAAGSFAPSIHMRQAVNRSSTY